MDAIPISRAKANEFIVSHHRHHGRIQGDVFRIGIEEAGNLIGVTTCGRPVSRYLDDGLTIEVTRLCTDGTENACSFIYSKAARIAKELGYKKIITYILETENGASLRASGWTFEGIAGGGDWNCKSRPRQTQAPTCKKQRWSKML